MKGNDITQSDTLSLHCLQDVRRITDNTVSLWLEIWTRKFANRRIRNATDSTAHTRWRNVDKGLNSLLLLSPSWGRHWNSARQRHQDGSQEFQPLSVSLIKLALWKQQLRCNSSRLQLQKWYRRPSRRFCVVSRDAVYKLTQARVSWNPLPGQILAMYLCISLNVIWWQHCYGD